MAEQELVEGAWSTQSTDLIMNHLDKRLETVDGLFVGRPKQSVQYFHVCSIPFTVCHGSKS